MKKYRWNHAMIAAGMTIVWGFFGSATAGALFAIFFYAGRETAQFFLKKHKFTVDVIVRHLGDVLAAVVGAGAVLFVLWVF